MKKQKLLNNLKHRLSLLLCLMAFLAVGQSAWGTTFTIQGNNYYFDELSWTSKNMTDIGNNTFTYSITAKNSGTNQGQLKFWRDGATLNSSQILTLDVEKNFRVGYSSPDYTYNEFQISSITAGSTYTVKLVYNNDNDIKITILSEAPVSQETTPEVRVGVAPVVVQNTGATISAYLAKQGCHSGAVATVSKITAYYSIETPTKSTTTKQTITGTYTFGNLYDITIPASELNKFGTAIIHVKLTATNNNTSGTQEGELSDEICFQWSQCAGIITSLQINPQGEQLTVNTPQTFTYTANDGATVNSVQWYKDGSPVATTTDYTFTPTTGASFTIGLKAFNEACNPTGFDAETQTYTVCVPVTGVEITGCPDGTATVGTELNLTATTTGGAATWVWTVNGKVQESEDGGNTSAITFTPETAGAYTVIAKATDCAGKDKSAQCEFVINKSFTHNDVTGKTFNACAGGHQFAWADMFAPTPSTWSAAVAGGADATDLFTLNNGVMVWNNDGMESGNYSYTFTAHKDGYNDATAVLSFTYTAAETPSGSIGTIEIIEGANPTYPWTMVKLSCSISGDIDHVVWSCSNTGLVESKGVVGSTATAHFKGKTVRKDTDYVVTAVGQNASCGSTEISQTITITVQPEEEEVCD